MTKLTLTIDESAADVAGLSRARADRGVGCG
jgi:hypothetical protein